MTARAIRLTLGVPSSLNYQRNLGVAFNNKAAIVRAVECCNRNVKASNALAGGLQGVIDHHEEPKITAINLAPVDDLEHEKPIATEIDAKHTCLRELGI